MSFLTFISKNWKYWSIFTFLLIYFLIIPLSANASSEWHQKTSWINREKSNPIYPFAPGSNNLAIDVGQIFLMGEMGANYSDSIGSQIHYTYSASELFAFDTSIGYSTHSEGKLSLASGLAGLRTHFGWYDKVVPYAVIGLGFYRPIYRNTGALSEIPSASTLFGVHVGPGVDLEVTKNLFFGAALTFHDIFATTKPKENASPLIGGTYTSFLLRAGVTF